MGRGIEDGIFAITVEGGDTIAEANNNASPQKRIEDKLDRMIRL